MTIRVLERPLARLAILALAVALAACHGKRPPVLAAPPPPSAVGGEAVTRPVDEGPGVQPILGEGAPGIDIPGGGAATRSEGGGPLANIRFDYDSAALTPAARATLDSHVVWLQSHRGARVTIEGHCDERGTVEYNLALGEKRARSAQDYLVGLGVAAERLRVVSYGKERPLDPAATEQAYAKNRRAHFAVAP